MSCKCNFNANVFVHHTLLLVRQGGVMLGPSKELKLGLAFAQPFLAAWQLLVSWYTSNEPDAMELYETMLNVVLDVKAGVSVLIYIILTNSNCSVP